MSAPPIPVVSSYDEFEAAEGFSPVSPEAYYAERAWNAALLTLAERINGSFASEHVSDALPDLLTISTD